MEGLQQDRYLWGSGGEGRVCLRRLVVSDPQGHTGGLLFHCTALDGHAGPHVAGMTARGPVRAVAVHWWDETSDPVPTQGSEHWAFGGELKHGRATD